MGGWIGQQGDHCSRRRKGAFPLPNIAAIPDEDRPFCVVRPAFRGRTSLFGRLFGFERARGKLSRCKELQAKSRPNIATRSGRCARSTWSLRGADD
jgi:hypothetical protein